MIGPIRKFITPTIIFALSFFVFFISHLHHPDWYKHFVYLAQAFLEGKADLSGLPGYYHDIIFYEGKTYLPNPPLPAVILMPFVAIWGESTNQVRVCMLIASLNVVLAWVLIGRIGIKGTMRALLTVLFGFGTVHYSAAILGTTWFFSHIVAVFFLLLCLAEFFGKRRPLLMGLFLGFSFLSRSPVILGAPFFLGAFFFKKKDLGDFWKNLILFSLGAAIPLGFQLYYNFIRFHNPLESGYLLQNYYSSVQAPAIEKYGFFNIRYIPQHLYILFLKTPDYIGKFPFFKPSPWGMSILLTTPAVIYALKAPIRDKVNIFAWVAILLISFPSLIYTATGWVQFGYRYSLDFIPFLLILTASGMGNRITLGKVSLIILSVIVNIWGVYWSVKLGW